MNHTSTTLMIATAVIGLALFMVAAAVVIAIPRHNAHAQVSVEGTSVFADQLTDNSQHASFGAGSAFNTASNSPTNSQTQTQTAGSTGSG